MAAAWRPNNSSFFTEMLAPVTLQHMQISGHLMGISSCGATQAYDKHVFLGLPGPAWGIMPCLSGVLL